MADSEFSRVERQNFPEALVAEESCAATIPRDQEATIFFHRVFAKQLDQLRRVCKDPFFICL